MADIETDLQPSKLGTKEHWDNVYEEELSNFHEIGDEGEIWFGEESVEKMLDWCAEHRPLSSQPYILEIGSGNGSLLFALVEAGYTSNKTQGIDYSPRAVALSRAIAASRGEGAEHVTFEVSDFLNAEPPLLSAMKAEGRDQWDIVLDKGTFDAIALMSKDDHGATPVERYPAKVAKLLRKGGYFLITSCNFTEEELKDKFTAQNVGLVYHSRVSHPTFTFGGQTGNVISTIAFIKPE